MDASHMPKVPKVGGSSLKAALRGLTTSGGKSIITTNQTPVVVEGLSGSVLLPQSVISSMKLSWSKGYDKILAIKMMAKIPDNDIARALKTFEKWAQPADLSDVVNLLGELRLLTIRPNNLSADDLKIQIKLYARKLMSFPAVEVVKILEKQPSRNQFWPSWREVEDEINYKYLQHKKIWDALKNYQEPVLQIKKIGKKYNDLTVAEKLDHKKMLDNIYVKMEENSEEMNNGKY